MLAGGPENISFIEQSSAVEAGMLLLGSLGALRKSSAAPTILSMPSSPGLQKSTWEHHLRKADEDTRPQAV